MADDAVRAPIGPELDLHPFHPRDIPSVVGDYLREAVLASSSDVRRVLGRWKSVQRAIVQAMLERHPLVAASRMDMRAVRFGTTSRGVP